MVMQVVFWTVMVIHLFIAILSQLLHLTGMCYQHLQLVGVFNPVEKYESKWESSTSRR